MRILDLDLDFFLNKVKYFGSLGEERLSDDEYIPWKEADVRRFLENQCGMKLDKPTPGRLVTHHHEAFHFWKGLIESGGLDTPFDVVHIDAHSDLGTGDSGYIYLMTDVLSLPVMERSNPKTGPTFMNAANYLAFAVACRWIRRIDFVPNDNARDDLMAFHFKNFDVSSATLQLKGGDARGIDSLMCGDRSYPFVLEPEVPFITIPENQFHSDGFSFGVLSQSPGFTPASSDALIQIIMEYFQPV